MKYDKIAKDLLASKKRYKDYDIHMMSAYDNGVDDILDAIGAVHPELVFDLHKIREAIEDGDAPKSVK